MNDTKRSTPQDGAYQYVCTPTYGASYPVLMVIQSGRVTAYSTGEGEGQTWESKEGLEKWGADLIEQLAYQIEYRTRAGSCMAQVNFCPVHPLEGAPTIGKGRAHKLHKIMGRLGLPHLQHYGLAAAALCEPFPLDSLATLTETEARRVWAHLCKLFPSARQYAA